MELNDLKSIWTKVVEADSTIYRIEERDIQHLISKKSNILFHKITRELKMKRWFMGTVSLVLIGLTIGYQFEEVDEYFSGNLFSRTEMTILNFMLGVLIFVLFVNIVLSYQQFKTFQESATDLKTALQTAVKLLVRIQKLAIYSDSFAMPVIIGWAVYRRLFGEGAFVWDKRVFYVILSMLFSLGLIFLFSRVMQQRKFGKYIDQLRQHIVDMELLNPEKEDQNCNSQPKNLTYQKKHFMKNKAWLRVLQALGILFILISVFFIPDSYPWYYEVLTGFIGWPLFFAPKWTKLKKELGF